MGPFSRLLFWLLGRRLAPVVVMFTVGVGVGFVLGSSLFIMPKAVAGYEAAHGITGTVTIQGCDPNVQGRATIRWACYGPFEGDDGTRIAKVNFDIFNYGYSTPAGEYSFNVASPSSTTAYPSDDSDFVLDAFFAVALIGFGGYFFYKGFRVWPAPKGRAFRPKRHHRRA